MGKTCVYDTSSEFTYEGIIGHCRDGAGLGGQDDREESNMRPLRIMPDRSQVAESSTSLYHSEPDGHPPNGGDGSGDHHSRECIMFLAMYKKSISRRSS